ncbi:MAG: hypothetical protein GC206_13320 [Alphaproteobacteria bacterium]|nr:hypothetical protein [Alphaproteobacteria bacterium]
MSKPLKKPKSFDRVLAHARRDSDRALKVAKTKRAKEAAAFRRKQPDTDSRPYDADEAGRTARAACAIVAAAFDLAPETLYRQTRGGAFESHARQVVYWLLHKPGRMSLEAAGLALGRDRSTVSHGVEAIETLIADPDVERVIAALGELFTRLAALARETHAALGRRS